MENIFYEKDNDIDNKYKELFLNIFNYNFIIRLTILPLINDSVIENNKELLENYLNKYEEYRVKLINAFNELNQLKRDYNPSIVSENMLNVLDEITNTTNDKIENEFNYFYQDMYLEPIEIE